MLRAKRSSLVNSGGGRWIKELSLPRRVSGEEEEQSDSEEDGIADDQNGESSVKYSTTSTGAVGDNKENFDREGYSKATVALNLPPRQATKCAGDTHRQLSTGNSVLQPSEDERPSPGDGLTGTQRCDDARMCGRPPTKPSTHVLAHSSAHVVPKSSPSEVHGIGRPVAVSKPLGKSSASGNLTTSDARHQNQNNNTQGSPDMTGGVPAPCTRQPPIRISRDDVTPSEPPIRWSHTSATPSQPNLQPEELSTIGQASSESGQAVNVTDAALRLDSQLSTKQNHHLHHHSHHHHHLHKDSEHRAVPVSTSDHFKTYSNSAHGWRHNDISEGGEGVSVTPHNTKNKQTHTREHSNIDYRHAPEQQQQQQQQHPRHHSSITTNNHIPSGYSTTKTTSSVSLLPPQDLPASVLPPQQHQYSSHQLQQQHLHQWIHHSKQPRNVTGDGKDVVLAGNAKKENNRHHANKMQDHVGRTGGSSARGSLYTEKQQLNTDSASTHNGSRTSKKRSSTVHVSCYTDRQRLDASSASIHSGSHTYTPTNTVHQQTGGVTRETCLHRCAGSSTVPGDGGVIVVATKNEVQDVCDGGGGEMKVEQDLPPVLTEQFVNETVVMRSSRGQRRLKKLKSIGGGGSSKIFQVLSVGNEVFALKEVYMRHLDPVIQQSFLKEVQLLRQLQGKQEIIRLHDYSWDKESHILYILLECADSDLNSLMKAGYLQHAVNPPLAIWQLWNEMLRIVKVIHDQGIIHNDLKPENFVCKGCNLRLIDFGISARIEAEHTSIERDVRCGTLNYMAPETIEATGDNDLYKVGKASDIWSLGCILYQMVYKKTPFDHIKNKMKKWQAILNCSTSVAYPQMPLSYSKLVEVIKTCLVKEPKKRPTIEDLLLFSSPENFTLP